MTGRVLVGVVVIMPTFTEGQERNPPAVGGIIFGCVGTVAEFVSGAIDQPSAVVEENESEEDPPHHKGPTVAHEKISGNEKEEAENKLDMNKVLIAELIKGIVCNIAGKAGQFLPCFDLEPHPIDMTPPESFFRTMMILIGVRVGVVMTVKANPLSRTTLAGEASAEDKNVLKPLGHLIASVRNQPVPTHCDSHTTREPVHKEGQTQARPGKVAGQKH